MRVLFLTCWYPHPGNGAFGAFVREHARAAQAAGVQLQLAAVLLLKGSAWLDISVADGPDESGFAQRIITIKSRWQPLLYNLPWLLRRLVGKHLDELVQQQKPQLIHAQVVYPAGWLAGQLGRKYRLPYLITEHWSGATRLLSHKLLGAQAQAVYQEAGAVTPVSTFLLNQIKEAQPALGPRLSVLPNVVSGQFEYRQKPDKVNGINLLMVMSLTPPKQPLLVLRALALLPLGLQSRLHLRIVGDGPLRPEAEQLAKALKGQTEFLGIKNKEEIAGLQSSAHLFLHASGFETFGVVVAEALTAGTPVVVSRAGALPDQVQAQWGLVAENTEAAWAQAIQQALATDYDYAAIAPHHAGLYSQQAVGAQMIDLYKKVAGR